MNVGSTASVVAGEDGLELDNALVIAGLDTAEESSIQVGGVGRVTVATGLNTGVDTLLWQWTSDLYLSSKFVHQAFS